MARHERKGPTLMPAIAVAALAAVVAIPTLSAERLHAATPSRYAIVTVHRGDALWSIAADHTANGDSVVDTMSRISAVNHLASSTIVPGQHLRIPIE